MNAPQEFTWPGDLTALESAVLTVLAASFGQPVSREAIAEAVAPQTRTAGAAWREPRANVLEVIVYRVRKKLRELETGVTIQAKRNAGYQLVREGGDA